jgi:hypothetical protein
MHDTKERLSPLWIFALLNYLYADVVALFAIAGSRNSFDPLPPPTGSWDPFFIRAAAALATKFAQMRSM